MDFDLLPTTVKCRIFSYLSFHSLHSKIANVSKSWQVLSRDPLAVLHIEIDDRYNSMEIMQYLRLYNLAQTLTITDLSKFDWVFRIPKNNNLRRLRLVRCSFDPVALVFLSTRFPSVSVLELWQCNYLDSEIQELSSVQIFFSENFVSDFIQFFSKNCRCLQQIDIDGEQFEVDNTSLQVLLKTHGSTLEKLRLIVAFALTDNNFNALSRLPKIKELELCFLRTMTDSQLLRIKKLESLRKLWLHQLWDVSENALAEFFMDPVFSKLQSVNLYGCWNLTDNIVDLMSKSYPDLKSIDISHCYEITDFGVLSIIKHCRCLKSLNLSNNPKVTAIILTRITTCLAHLKYLNISECKEMIDVDVHQLELTKPNLRLIYS